MEQEKYSEAEVAMKEAIALNPQDYKNRMSYGTRTREPRFAVDRNRPIPSGLDENVFIIVIALGDPSAEPHFAQGNCGLHAGVALFKVKRREEAIEAFTRAIEIDPGAVVYTNRGMRAAIRRLLPHAGEASGSHDGHQEGVGVGPELSAGAR